MTGHGATARTDGKENPPCPSPRTHTASQNTDHIRVTHAGSLPRTPELIAANEAKEAEGITPEFLDLLQTSVVDVVQRQKDLGIDIPNDGE